MTIRAFALGGIVIALLTACGAVSTSSPTSTPVVRTGILTTNILVDTRFLESEPPGIFIDDFTQLVQFHVRIMQEGNEFSSENLPALTIRSKKNEPMTIYVIGSSFDWEKFVDLPDDLLMFVLEYSQGGTWILLKSEDYVMTSGQELKLRVRPVSSDWLPTIEQLSETPEEFNEFVSKWRLAVSSLMGTTKQSAIGLEGCC